MLRTLLFWAVGTFVVLAALFFAPREAFTAECYWRLEEVRADLDANGGTMVDLVRVPGEEFTHLMIVEIGGHIVMSFVVGDCVVSMPIVLGSSAKVTEG